MNIRACMLMASVLAVAGCQTTGEMTDVERQAILLAAVPSNYRQIVPLSFRTVVPDPTGIRTSEISRPLLGELNARSDAPLVCVRVQYGNEPGGAGESRAFAFGFRDGEIIDSQQNNAACATATYSLFPELRSAYPAFAPAT